MEKTIEICVGRLLVLSFCFIFLFHSLWVVKHSCRHSVKSHSRWKWFLHRFLSLHRLAYSYLQAVLIFLLISICFFQKRVLNPFLLALKLESFLSCIVFSVCSLSFLVAHLGKYSDTLVFIIFTILSICYCWGDVLLCSMKDWKSLEKLIITHKFK